MPRTMRMEDTEIYRAVVSTKQDGGGVSTVIYGPHDSSNQARDHRIRSTSNPVRIVKQKLEGDIDGLYWQVIKTYYRNDGESADWDE